MLVDHGSGEVEVDVLVHAWLPFFEASCRESR
jgi:hypothetical protein